MFCLIGVGCAPPRPDPAVIAYQKLMSALSYGDQKATWSSLAKETRLQLVRKIDQTAHVSEYPEAIRLELDWALESPFAGAAHAIELADQSSDEKVKWISAVYASQSWVIPVIFQEGEWRVHLLDARHAPQRSSLHQ